MKNNKQALYESIIQDVSKCIKDIINEDNFVDKFGKPRLVVHRDLDNLYNEIKSLVNKYFYFNEDSFISPTRKGKNESYDEVSSSYVAQVLKSRRNDFISELYHLLNDDKYLLPN